MSELSLQPIQADDGHLRAALTAAALPIDDIDEPGRSFFQLRESNQSLGFSGIERCGGDVLLRSMVILPEHRGRGHGKQLGGLTLALASPVFDAYLATTNAATFFEDVGLVTVQRESVPQPILSTRQLSGLCPASATIMKRNGPPT